MTEEPTTFTATIISQLQFAHWAALRNLDGVTHEESVVRPDSGANDGNWVVGHIIVVRNRLLPALGEEALWDEARSASYVMPSTDDTTGRVPFEELRAAFVTSHERLTAGIARLDDAASRRRRRSVPATIPRRPCSRC